MRLTWINVPTLCGPQGVHLGLEWVLGSAMRTFRVTFLKAVCGDTGQDFDATQGVFDVSAEDDYSAAEIAKAQFCRARHISKWSVNADKYLVHPLVEGVEA
jgi:hypothetical protein